MASRSAPVAVASPHDRSAPYGVTLDAAFAQVVAGCAEPRDAEGGTWITAGMAEAYNRLAALGYAPSVEVWSGATVVGGLYGVALGRMFYAESMFSRRRDASKVALVYLVRQLERWGFELIDCPDVHAPLASLGAARDPSRRVPPAVGRLIRLPGVPSPRVLAPDLEETIRIK